MKEETTKTSCDTCVHNDAGICHHQLSKKFNKDVSGDTDKCNQYEEN